MCERFLSHLEDKLEDLLKKFGRLAAERVMAKRQRDRAAKIRIANRQVKRKMESGHPPIPRQAVGSRRRQQLHAIRAAWQKTGRDRDSAAARLWEDAHQSGTPGDPCQDLRAWPRLQKRKRAELATEVEAFVIGSQ